MVEGLECQGLLRLVKDDTSSLLWVRDSQSIGTYRSTGPQDFGTINATFEFDTEVFASKVYRTATRSSMLRTMLLDARPDDQQGCIDPTLGPSPKQIYSGWHVINESTTDQKISRSTFALGEQTMTEKGDNTLNTELQRLPSAKAGPQYTIYTLEALKRLPLVSIPPKASPLPKNSQQSVEERRRLLTRSWKPRPSSPNLGVTDLTQMKSPDVKVLVLGTSESGKSTLIKSLKTEYLGGYDEESRLRYRDTILRNLWEATKCVAQALEMEENSAGNVSPQVREDRPKFAAACNLLKESPWDYVLGPRESNEPNADFRLRPDASSAIQTLWNDAHFHQVLEKAILQSSFYVNDAVSQ